MRAALRSRAKLIGRALGSNPTIPVPALPAHSSLSYSGSGEDLVARTHLLERGIELSKIFYVDIGAAEPEFLSNTMYFYRCGASGVLIEPDPAHLVKLNGLRPRDVILPIGVSATERGSLELYRLTDGVFNTFSCERAESVVRQSANWMPHQRQEIIGTAQVEVLPIGDVLAQHCPGKTIHFMSIDIEGANFEILRAIDFGRFRPIVLCVERNASKAEHEELLGPFGYELCYSNNDNLIFVQSR